ncbi:TetR/AcrR family transcriptional regulator [bacterium]|nr:TetR/AcrR family transcriptional regulator [bacterium]
MSYLDIIPVPQQLRSKEALTRFIETGEQLLLENRFELTGIADLAKLSQSSIGTFYRVLTDKETLFRVLFEKFREESISKMREVMAPERWTGSTVVEIADGYVRLLTEIFDKKEGLIRAMRIRSSSDPVYREGLYLLNSYCLEVIRPLLMPCLDAIKHPKPYEAIEFGVSFLLGSLNYQNLAGSRVPEYVEAFPDELVLLFRRYLGLES